MIKIVNSNKKEGVCLLFYWIILIIYTVSKILIASDTNSNPPQIETAVSNAWNGFITISNPKIKVIIDKKQNNLK